MSENENIEQMRDALILMSESWAKAELALSEARGVIAMVCDAGTKDVFMRDGSPAPWDYVLIYHEDMNKARAWLAKYGEGEK